jgi:hypothetical protein
MKPRSEVFDTYWRFAAERQAIFFRRLEGAPPPYTEDPILQTYKFCNVYRACDRVSQFLIQGVIYKTPRNPLDTLFRIFLFRLLNRSETWQALEHILGDISLESFSVEQYTAALEQLKSQGPIYGNAFILCANKAYGFDQKHRNHLALLEEVFQKTQTGKYLLDSPTLKELFLRLRELPLIGDFMAYQLAIDFNYSEVFNFNENDFTIAGPGAWRGIHKCFEDIGTAHSDEIILWMIEHQQEEFARLNVSFRDLGGRPLHAIDCQGLFCEVDKYSRVRFPSLASNRVRIKATYRPSSIPLIYRFPPKWGVQL